MKCDLDADNNEQLHCSPPSPACVQTWLNRRRDDDDDDA